jgi:hypothetical protein
MKSSYNGFSSRVLGGVGGLLAGGVLGPVTYVFLVRELSKEFKSSYIKAPVLFGAGFFGVVISPVLITIFALMGARLGVELGAEKFFDLMKIMFVAPADRKVYAAEGRPQLSNDDANSTTELTLLLQREASPAPSPLPTVAANVVFFTGGHSARLFPPPSPARQRGTRPPDLHIETNLGYTS